MKKLLLILIVCCSLKGFGQDWNEFKDSIQKIIQGDYGKKISGKGVIDSLQLKQGKWTFFISNNIEKKHSEGTFLNDKKFGRWETFYLNTSNRVKTKEVYKGDSLFHLTYYSEVLVKKIELISEVGLSKTSSKEIEKICYHSQSIIFMLMDKGYSPNDAKHKMIDFISSLLLENKDSATLKFWNYDKLLCDIRTFNNGIMSQEVIDYYSKNPSKYSYFINGIKTEEKQLIETNPNHFQITKFFSNGKRSSQTTFKNGQPIGNHKEWDESGKLTLKQRYK